MINILFNENGIEIMILPKVTRLALQKPLTLNIQNYAIENFKFKYFDESSKIKWWLTV
jgi:hypothetical protein